MMDASRNLASLLFSKEKERNLQLTRILKYLEEVSLKLTGRDVIHFSL